MCCACVQPVCGPNEIERRTETTLAAVLDQRPSTNRRCRPIAVSAGIHSPSVDRTTTTTTVINKNNIAAAAAAAIGGMIFSTESSRPVVVGALVVFLVAGCFCGPLDDRARTDGRQEDVKRQDDGKPLPMTGRTSRLQRPTQGNGTVKVMTIEIDKLPNMTLLSFLSKKAAGYGPFGLPLYKCSRAETGARP